MFWALNYYWNHLFWFKQVFSIFSKTWQPFSDTFDDEPLNYNYCGNKLTGNVSLNRSKKRRQLSVKIFKTKH